MLSSLWLIEVPILLHNAEYWWDQLDCQSGQWMWWNRTEWSGMGWRKGGSHNLAHNLDSSLLLIQCSIHCLTNPQPFPSSTGHLILRLEYSVVKNEAPSEPNIGKINRLTRFLNLSLLVISTTQIQALCWDKCRKVCQSGKKAGEEKVEEMQKSLGSDKHRCLLKF